MGGSVLINKIYYKVTINYRLLGKFISFLNTHILLILVIYNIDMKFDDNFTDDPNNTLNSHNIIETGWTVIKMNPDELEKMRKELEEIMKASLQGPWKHSGMSFSTARSTSPSATDSHYPYQEPERDEQGTFYGYKILWFHVEGMFFISPRYQVQWRSNGCLVSDVEPRENHMHGIHFAKRPDHPNLEEYIVDEWSIGQHRGRFNSMLVKCALSGTVVETDQGFRAQHAQITGVVIDGNWKSYQDLERYSAARSRRNPYEEEYRRLFYGDWNPNP